MAFCIRETNRFRELLGRGPVSNPDDLQQRAQAGAAYDHTNGPHAYTQRHGHAGAENEAVGWPILNRQIQLTITAVIETFYREGPGGGHFENLRGPYSQAGCGVVVADNRMTLTLILR